MFNFNWLFYPFLLSHLIFDVEVIHSNSNIRKLVASELEKYNIKQWQFKPHLIN